MQNKQQELLRMEENARTNFALYDNLGLFELLDLRADLVCRERNANTTIRSLAGKMVAGRTIGDNAMGILKIEQETRPYIRLAIDKVENLIEEKILVNTQEWPKVLKDGSPEERAAVKREMIRVKKHCEGYVIPSMDGRKERQGHLSEEDTRRLENAWKAFTLCDSLLKMIENGEFQENNISLKK